MNNFRIVETALISDAESICLTGGKVEFKVLGSWVKFGFTAEEYRLLWDAAHTLELNDSSRCRAMAPHLLPVSLQDSWTLRVYVGPNAFGKTNVLLDPLPTKLSDFDLSKLLEDRD